MDCRIFYLILLEEYEPKDASIFQGFSPGVIEATAILEKIISLPSNILQFYNDRDTIIRMRMCGDFTFGIIPLQVHSYMPSRVESLRHLPVSPQLPFWCCFSNEHSVGYAEEIIKDLRYPVLHITTASSESIISIDKFNKNHLLNYIKNVSAIIEKELPKKEREALTALLSKDESNWEPQSIGLGKRDHGCTMPNEITLESLNYILDTGNPLIGNSNSPYIEAICASFDAISEERQRILNSGKPMPYHSALDLILTAPSLYRDHYVSQRRIHHLSDSIDAKALRFAYKQLTRQKDYFFLARKDEFEKSFDSPTFQSIMQTRLKEIAAYTYAVTIKSSSHFIPTLRLPPEVNTLHPDLRRLADCFRGTSPHRDFKTNKIAGKIAKNLSRIVDSAFVDRIDRKHNVVKLICDAPLEWLPIRNLPMMLRHETSRIPTTPGDLLFSGCTQCEQKILLREAFKKILVIRSYDKRDPIKNFMKSALEIPRNYEDLPTEYETDVNVVDVSSADELVRELNSFDGAVMVFDGHGDHSKEKDVGGLRIGEHNLDTWDLRKQARIPPIVILTACDTHPIDASHASTANGFLAAGAMTVLGTFLPVDAHYAAAFISRLILRIGAFLHILTQEMDRSVRWIQVITGLQRMNYVTELTHIIVKRGKYSLSMDALMRIWFQANSYINQFDEDWYEKTLEDIANETGKTIKEIKGLFRSWANITETLKYIQLGNPELILIPAKTITDYQTK